MYMNLHCLDYNPQYRLYESNLQRTTDRLYPEHLDSLGRDVAPPIDPQTQHVIVSLRIRAPNANKSRFQTVKCLASSSFSAPKISAENCIAGSVDGLNVRKRSSRAAKRAYFGNALL